MVDEKKLQRYRRKEITKGVPQNLTRYLCGDHPGLTEIHFSPIKCLNKKIKLIPFCGHKCEGDLARWSCCQGLAYFQQKSFLLVAWIHKDFFLSSSQVQTERVSLKKIIKTEIGFSKTCRSVENSSFALVI